jgi:hypothetical protein
MSLSCPQIAVPLHLRRTIEWDPMPTSAVLPTGDFKDLSFDRIYRFSGSFSNLLELVLLRRRMPPTCALVDR